MPIPPKVVAVGLFLTAAVLGIVIGRIAMAVLS